jgi:hypothetical protein
MILENLEDTSVTNTLIRIETIVILGTDDELNFCLEKEPEKSCRILKINHFFS